MPGEKIDPVDRASAIEIGRVWQDGELRDPVGRPAIPLRIIGLRPVRRVSDCEEQFRPLGSRDSDVTCVVELVLCKRPRSDRWSSSIR